MTRIVAWFLIVAGTASVLLATILVAVVRPYQFRWRRNSRDLWRHMRRAGSEFDSSIFHTPAMRAALEDLQRENPTVAAEMRDNIRQFEEIEASSDDPFKDARQFTRIFDIAAYFTAVLVLVGAVALVSGVLWLRAR